MSSDTDNADTALFSLIKSLSALNGLPKGNESLHAHLPAIAEQRQVNAVRDYLSVLSWDGVDRFKNLAETLSSHNPVIAEISIRRWLIQACAAVDSADLSQKHNPRMLAGGGGGAGNSQFQPLGTQKQIGRGLPLQRKS